MVTATVSSPGNRVFHKKTEIVIIFGIFSIPTGDYETPKFVVLFFVLNPEAYRAYVPFLKVQIIECFLLGYYIKFA